MLNSGMPFCGEFSEKVSPDFQSCGIECPLPCNRLGSLSLNSMGLLRELSEKRESHPLRFCVVRRFSVLIALRATKKRDHAAKLWNSQFLGKGQRELASRPRGIRLVSGCRGSSIRLCSPNFSLLHVDSLACLPDNPKRRSKIGNDSCGFRLKLMVAHVLGTVLLRTNSLTAFRL